MIGKDPPIVVLERKMVARNSLFSVSLDKVESRDGQIRVVDFLRVEPLQRTSDGVSGVAILPVLAGKLGLLRVFRYPLGLWSWEAPRGMIDAGESPRQAAVRELAEETGHVIDSSSVLEEGVIAPEGGIIDGKVALFSAIVESRPEPRVRQSELGHAAFHLFSVDQAQRMLYKQDIVDGVTTVLLLKYLLKEAGV